MTRALPPLQKSLVVYGEKRFCFSCHNQTVPLVALRIARRRSDGTWYVASRSEPFQPYFEIGFPYGKDQFIAVAASAWATAALALALPPVP